MEVRYETERPFLTKRNENFCKCICISINNIDQKFSFTFGSHYNPNENVLISINIGTKRKSEPIDKITVLHICIGDCGSDIFFSKFSIGEHYYRLSYLVHMFNQTALMWSIISQTLCTQTESILIYQKADYWYPVEVLS